MEAMKAKAAEEQTEVLLRLESKVDRVLAILSKKSDPKPEKQAAPKKETKAEKPVEAPPQAETE
jgi:hypothetical protein